MRLLVIEDNTKMAAFIAEGLSEQGHVVDLAHNGGEGERLAAAESYDLIILDLMLPDQDGVHICRNLRRRGLKTPVLMLMALSTTADKVTGLDAGADDYMTKPFEFDELVARVRALLRRGQAQEASTLQFEDVEMDLVGRKVSRAGQRLNLTAKEFALLEYFMRNPNRVYSRETLLDAIWGYDVSSEIRTVDVHIRRLREKLEKNPAQPEHILTKWGVGYYFKY